VPDPSPTPSGIRIWLMAARVRTLPAAVAPVLVGTALAGFVHVFHPLRFIAALVGAIFIQVGTNLSNDYSDARRGADTEDRLGPVRVTAGGVTQYREINPSGSYLSTSDMRLYIGLGKETVAQRLEIEWPRGKKQVLENVPAGQVLTLDEANAR